MLHIEFTVVHDSVGTAECVTDIIVLPGIIHGIAIGNIYGEIIGMSVIICGYAVFKLSGAF